LIKLSSEIRIARKFLRFGGCVENQIEILQFKGSLDMGKSLKIRPAVWVRKPRRNSYRGERRMGENTERTADVNSRQKLEQEEARRKKKTAQVIVL